MLRNLFALANGVFAAAIVVTFSQLANLKLFPTSVGAQGLDAAQVQAVFAQMPWPAVALLVGGWLLAAFAGGLVTTKLAGTARTLMGLVPGLLIVAATWHWARTVSPPAMIVDAILVLALPMAWLGARLALRLERPPPQDLTWRGGDR
jgi:hypothetical protein